MCEKKTKKVKKGSKLTRLREARRVQRLQLITSPVSTSDESNSLPPLTHQPQIERITQNRVIFELALKTIALMHKNKLIQQKIIALQKETSEFVASVMNNPQNRQQYDQMRHCGVAQGEVQMQGVLENKNLAVKVEPKI